MGVDIPNRPSNTQAFDSRIVNKQRGGVRGFYPPATPLE
jgi:hypothetical protein